MPASSGLKTRSSNKKVLPLGGDSAVSTGTGLLSAGVGVRLGEAGSLSIE